MSPEEMTTFNIASKLVEERYPDMLAEEAHDLLNWIFDHANKHSLKLFIPEHFEKIVSVLDVFMPIPPIILGTKPFPADHSNEVLIHPMRMTRVRPRSTKKK